MARGTLPPLVDRPSLACSLRILHELCKSLGLNLTTFIQYDENAWTQVGDMKLRNYVVEKMPEKLGYNLRPQEKGRAPEDIFQMALNKVGTPTGPEAPPPTLLPCAPSLSLWPAFPSPPHASWSPIAASSIFSFPASSANPQSPTTHTLSWTASPPYVCA